MSLITDTLNAIYQKAESVIEALATKTHFLFSVTGLPQGTFKVLHWQGNEAISTSYQYTLSLVAEGFVDEAKILGKTATLSIDWHGEMRLIHGQVASITHMGSLVADHAQEYELVIESSLAKLNRYRQNRVFLNLDVKAVLEKVLLSAGFEANSFKFDLTTSYPVREYTVQYNETDFNFFTRLLEHAGLFYTFKQQEEQALLVIQDDSAMLPRMAEPAELSFLPATGQVEGEESVQILHQAHCYSTQSIKRKDYNYRIPETNLLHSTTTRSPVPSVGTSYIYGERIGSLAEGEQLVRRRQEALDWQRVIYLAETNCRGMTAGTTFTVNGHPSPSNNGDLLVISVLHEGDQSHAFAFGSARSKSTTAKTYRNELKLIRKETAYRTPVDLTLRPQVNGVITAKIETTGGEYAYLDDQGRYRLKNMFDMSQTQDGEASHPVRMVQPYAGSNHGVHFPLHAGTEVVVVCLHGDPDRPIIIGAAANPNSRSPVTSANNTQNIVRTHAGNELMMDDLEGSEKINLHTLDQKNILTLDASTDKHKVSLRTEEGRADIYAKKTISFESGDTYTLLTGKNQTITVKNQHGVQTHKKEIAFNAGTDISFSAKHNIKLSAEEKDIALTAGQDLIVEAGNTMSVRVIDGDIILTNDQGQLAIEAAKVMTISGKGGGEIKISQGDGTIEISTGGDLTINASSVEISGGTVNVKGQQVGVA